MQTHIQARLATAMREAGMDSLLLTDPENLGYVAGPLLPCVRQTQDRAVLALYAPSAPSPCTLYLFPDLAQAAVDQSPAAACVTVDERSSGLPCLLAAMTAGKPETGHTVGVDYSQTPHNQLSALRAALPDRVFTDAGPLLRGLRMVKLPEEIERIEMACRQADTGLIGALNHMEGAQAGSAYRKGFYTVSEFIERVRIHAYEGGTSLSGHMAAVAGPDLAADTMPRQGFLPSHGLCRVEYACCHAGYWSVNARMIHIDEPPDPSALKACADNLSLKRTAAALLRPGALCRDIHAAVVRAAAAAGVPLLPTGLGHGVGRGEIEGPFLHEDDATPLRENMVIALDVATSGPGGAMIRSIDIYAITSGDPRLLSWHRNWDKPYLVTGFRSAH